MSRPADHPTPPPQRRRLRKRWIVLALGVILCAWFGRFAYLRITLRPTPRPAYWEAKLAALDPPAPDAPSVEQVQALLSKWPSSDEHAFHPCDRLFIVGIPHPNCALRYNESNLGRIFENSDFRQVRTSLLEALGKGWDLQLDDQGQHFHMELLTEWAQVLIRHARWRQWGDSENRPVTRFHASTIPEDWQAVLWIARQISRQRNLIATRTAAQVERLLADELIQSARADCDLLDPALLAAEIDANIFRAARPSEYFEGERLTRYAAMESFYVREGGDWLDVSTFVDQNFMLPRKPSRLWNLASPLFHTLEEARAAAVDKACAIIDGWTSQAELDGFIPTRAWVDARTETGLNVGSWLDLHQSARVLRELYEAHSRMDTALTMHALRAFHSREGRWPDDLAELVPAYLPRLPVDYRDLKPLRYRRRSDGYELIGIEVVGDVSGIVPSPPADSGRRP